MKPSCTCTPEPPSVWVKGVCAVCWHWKYTPKFRADLERKAIRVHSVSPVESAPRVKCRHRSDESLNGVEATALGLGTVRRYFRCSLGLTLNAAKVPGVVCNCGGCGPRCPNYVPEEEQA
jgi:hypothetical protein